MKKSLFVMLYIVTCLTLAAGCGLHANPAVWAAHDRLFECDYSQVEPVYSPENQRRAMSEQLSPPHSPFDTYNTCDSWSWSAPAPRRMVSDCIHYLNSSIDCTQYSSRMFACDACYVSWRDSH